MKNKFKWQLINDSVTDGDKKALTDFDEQFLKSLSLDNNFTFNEIAKIYLLNLNTNNYKNINFDENDKENFFIKAVYRLYNEKN